MTNGIDGTEYDKMKSLAQDVLLDYGVNKFPVDVYGLAKKIGMNVIPYSRLPKTCFEKLKTIKGADQGMTILKNVNGVFKYDTFYNDIGSTPAACRFTIAHEIKHVVACDFKKEEIGEKDEILADYFAKCLLAPQAIIVEEKLQSAGELVNRFDISRQVADILSYTIEKRRLRFGSDFLFDNEKVFLRISKLL